jgi:mRNA-degrading endonuclease RelE of RelBE toxin-antitoxin system
MRILIALGRYSLTGEGDVKALSPPLRGNRLRVGPWRILCEPLVTQDTIEVQRIKNRSEAYRVEIPLEPRL